MDNAAWAELTGQVVVLDTSTPFVYLGTLSRVLDHFVVLKDVDVHDRNESPSTQEQYVMAAKRFGVRPNRKEVSIRKEVVASVSRLEDVVLY